MAHIMTEPPRASSSERDRAERGTTTIADRVVERIASRAASEVDGVRAVPASALTRLLRGTSESQVDVTVASNVARVELQVAVEYPRTLPAIANTIGERVIERVQHLTGMAVESVSIVVAELHAEPRTARRVQ
jgi:uncharacterized alkaline shock family protein YloU